MIRQSIQAPLHKSAYLLGLAGLIPFVALTAMMFHSASISLFLTYSAVILSFLGGIHWGFALQQPEWANTRRISLSMLPSLTAWLALALSPQVAIVLLLVTYSLWWIYDIKQLSNMSYRRLRRCLTLVVMVCHISWLVFYF